MEIRSDTAALTAGVAETVPAIDWSRPWLAPWRDPGRQVHADWQRGMTLADALNRQRPIGISFVTHQELPRGTPYEAFIRASGCCPVRETLHDFFNGLAWLRFPRSKSTLNRLHGAHALDAQGRDGQRGAQRDALTVFDENAAICWSMPAALADALRAQEWDRVFGTHRSLWRDARLSLFGHALLEKLEQPRKNICAHVLLLEGPGACADEELSAALEFQLPRCDKWWVPLPVLGVPGWWPPNEVEGFYADRTVFRPAASRRS